MKMNPLEQVEFVNTLTETVAGYVTEKIMSGAVPSGWDGHELRCLLAELFERESKNTWLRRDLLQRRLRYGRSKEILAARQKIEELLP